MSDQYDYEIVHVEKQPPKVTFWILGIGIILLIQSFIFLNSSNVNVSNWSFLFCGIGIILLSIVLVILGETKTYLKKVLK